VGITIAPHVIVRPARLNPCAVWRFSTANPLRPAAWETAAHRMDMSGANVQPCGEARAPFHRVPKLSPPSSTSPVDSRRGGERRSTAFHSHPPLVHRAFHSPAQGLTATDASTCPHVDAVSSGRRHAGLTSTSGAPLAHQLSTRDGSYPQPYPPGIPRSMPPNRRGRRALGLRSY